MGRVRQLDDDERRPHPVGATPRLLGQARFGKRSPDERYSGSPPAVVIPHVAALMPGTEGLPHALRRPAPQAGPGRDLRPRLHPCGLMLAARITLAHFSVSSAISVPNWTGDPCSGVPPRSARRAFILGSPRAALTSLLSLLTISAGVAFGAPRPYQIPPS